MALPFNREEAIKRCQDVFHITPKDLQLDVVECIGTGRDCILIAGCGWGKSLVYFLPTVLWTDRIIVVISPLRALIQEQQLKLASLGIRSTALMGGDITGIDSGVAAGLYRVIFMTPEIIFENKRVQELWFDKRWRMRLQAVVLDEAHCVTSWGTTFRKLYGRLGELRTWVLPSVAFIAVSATLPPQALADLKHRIHFKGSTSVINVGNDRPNIRLEVRHFKPNNKLRHLDFLMDFQKTIVYFESRNETVTAMRYLQGLVTDVNDSRIASCLGSERTQEALESSATKKDITLYHALMSEDYKRKTMEAFRQGNIRLLLSTEAAGMGCDINDVDRVVQVRCPTSISSLVQRLGRAARDPKRQGLGILLVPPPSDETKYADEHLKEYIVTQKCRRKVLNDVYGNVHHPNENCCDLCHPTRKSSYPQGQISFTKVLTAVTLTTAYIPKTRVPKRTFEQNELAKEALRNWRAMAFVRDLAPLCDSFEPRCVMTDNMIQVLGENFAKITTPADIRSIITWTPVVELQRQEVADILIRLNKDIDMASAQPPQEAGQFIDGQSGANIEIDREADESHQTPAAVTSKPTSKRPSLFKNRTASNFFSPKKSKKN